MSIVHAQSGADVGAAPIARRVKVTCSACSSSHVEFAIELKKLPLTGVFLDRPNPGLVHEYDQGLCVCADCGHAQLRNCLAPEAVYDQTYFHRSSSSRLARNGNDAFARFVRSVVGTRSFQCLLEIGANDLYLIEQIRDLAVAAVGLDPIWKQEVPPQRANVQVLGKFVEELSHHDLPAAPDLVISVQTFEHVDEPVEQLARIVDLSADDAIIFLEVPDFGSLLRNLRFDQVFHQHIQYFSLSSLLRLIELLGCSYLAHSVNYRYWGGALGVAFRKRARAEVGPTTNAVPHTNAPTSSEVKNRFIEFRRHVSEIMHQISQLPTREIYGFGGAQMVPTLAYHMKSDLSFLRAILDDDPHRNRLRYPGLAVEIRNPTPRERLDESAVLITAVDSARPIMRRVLELNPQHIIVPFPGL